MESTIIYIVLAALIGGYLFSKVLKTINYDLKGFEVLLYQIAFLLVFHLGRYYHFDYYQTYIGIFLFLMVGVYLLIHSIKKNKYIETVSMIFLFISMIFNYLSIKYTPYDLSNSSYVIMGLTILAIILIDFMIMFGSKTNLNIEPPVKKNKVLLMILGLVTTLNLIYGYVGNKLLEKETERLAIEHLEKKYSRTTKYEIIEEKTKCSQYKCTYKYKTNNKFEYYDVKVKKDSGEVKSEFKHCLTKNECMEKAEETASQYLNSKYGKFDYEKNDDETYCSSYYCTIVFDSKYTDEPFTVKIDREKYSVTSDDFLELYFSKLLDENIRSVYSLETHIVEALEEKIIEEYELKYGIEIKFGYSDFEKDLDEIYFGKLPTLEDLEKYVKLDVSRTNISKVFTADQLNEFNDYIIMLFEEFKERNMVEDYDTLRFNFADTNPFYQSGSSYKTSGYIRDSGSYYLIYTQPKPTQVEKK